MDLQPTPYWSFGKKLIFRFFFLFFLLYIFFNPNGVIPFTEGLFNFYIEPMGLAWTFMGYSEGYNYFTGGAEVLAGLLLLFRRTATLGAIVTFVVMGNVMAMNYSFDIPVKLLSTTLVVMSLFLMAKDIRRLYYFFFLNKTTPPANISAPYIRRRGLRITLLLVKVLVVLYGLGLTIYGGVTMLSKYGDKAEKAPLYGIYNVETFVLNNDTLPPLQTDEKRWKQLIVGGYKTYPASYIKRMNDVSWYYTFRPDTVNKKIVMFLQRDSSVTNHLVYCYPDKDHLEMKGKWDGDSIYVRMKKYDLINFRLVNRGFHWINEYPFNR